ncbi:Gti1/Pac2 family-domain-containing protein [Mycena floridula]|nr:Gti1/Pac2 family-domain-containing protein [Mycena floridula]
MQPSFPGVAPGLQRPTCTGLKVRSPADAHVVFHAVSLNLLPMVSRRLDTEERRAISSGHVFVWEERGSTAEATGLGIERWTDSIHWGPSRVREEFLFYSERDPEPQADVEMNSEESDNTPVPSHSGMGIMRENLVKQTYSVFVETPRGRRKWHLIAYFTQESLEYLRTIEDIPILNNIQVPPGRYRSARSANRRTTRSDGPGDRYNPSYSNIFAPYPAALMVPEPAQTTPRRLFSPSGRFCLAPLAYLQNLTPPSRHPVDEAVLMAFRAGLL